MSKRPVWACHATGACPSIPRILVANHPPGDTGQRPGPTPLGGVLLVLSANYVAVDAYVMGTRKVTRKEEEAREAAVVLRQGGKYPSILRDDLQGGLQ